MKVNDGNTLKNNSEEVLYLNKREKKNYDRQFFSHSFFLWKIITLTEAHITNVICVIVGDSAENFSSIFLVWLIKLSLWTRTRVFTLKEMP